KIAVCIKQVPTREWQPRINDARTWIREQDASYELNEPDAYALEEALRLREKHSGEVVVCAAGPTRIQQVIREALARGADRAIHVDDDSLAIADDSARPAGEKGSARARCRQSDSRRGRFAGERRCLGHVRGACLGHVGRTVRSRADRASVR